MYLGFIHTKCDAVAEPDSVDWQHWGLGDNCVTCN